MGKSKTLPPSGITPRWVPWVQHGAPAAVFIFYGILWQTAPRLIPQLGQEDSWIEWLTVTAFGSASVAFVLVGLKQGLKVGWFAWGLAAFCFFVAGEEISWGQRLVGFVPPEIFLENNFQKESNLHNLVAKQFGPSWMIIIILAGWGVLLPVLRRTNGSLLARFSVIEPPLALAIWSILGIVLLRIYPIQMTAEYVELITGLLFLVTALPMLELEWRTSLALAAPLAVVAAAASYLIFQDTLGSPKKIACAEAETDALAAGIETGAAMPPLLRRRSSDRRVHTYIQDGMLKPEIVKSLDSVVCEGVSNDPDRRRFAIDPWGQPYWMYYERDDEDGSGNALFYSFGQNRRYDSPDGTIKGTDDIGTWSRPLDPETGLPQPE